MTLAPLGARGWATSIANHARCASSRSHLPRDFQRAAPNRRSRSRRLRKFPCRSHRRRRHALQGPPPVISQPLPQLPLRRLPRRRGPLKDAATRRCQFEKPLAPIPTREASDPARRFEWRQCAAQGCAVGCENVSQSPLSNRARARQDLEQGELGGAESLRSQHCVVELGDCPSGAAQVGARATQRDRAGTVVAMSRHESMVMHPIAHGKASSMLAGAATGPVVGVRHCPVRQPPLD